MTTYTEEQLRYALAQEFSATPLDQNTLVDRVINRLSTPKPRPAFVGDRVLGNCLEQTITRLHPEHPELVMCVGGINNTEGPIRLSNLTHPDGAPVSRVFAAIPAEYHESQLLQLDELEDDGRYWRVIFTIAHGTIFNTSGPGSFWKRQSGERDLLGYLPVPIIVRKEAGE